MARARKARVLPGQLALFLDEPDKPSLIAAMTANLPEVDPEIDPFRLLLDFPVALDCMEREIISRGGTLPEGWRTPRFDFHEERKEGSDGRIKRRTIGKPTIAMRLLQYRFEEFIREACKRVGDPRLVRLPSATAFVLGGDPLRNVVRHEGNRYFYIVDLRHAYDSIDTELLVLLLTAIVGYPAHQDAFAEFLRLMEFGIREDPLLDGLRGDPLFARMRKFVTSFCRGPTGNGIVTGSPSSPYLFNLFCEMTLDAGIRRFCLGEWGNGIRYSRYADDLVLSNGRPIFPPFRQKVRYRIAEAGFLVNHRKSRVLDRAKGTVFFTGFGLSRHDPEGYRYQMNRITFPGKKRRALQGMIRTFLVRGEGNPDEIGGHVAHFLHYVKAVRPTVSDRKLIELCLKFKKAKCRI